jgi:outer membrane protein OmpA-like peptidoglycan-associated protein
MTLRGLRGIPLALLILVYSTPSSAQELTTQEMIQQLKPGALTRSYRPQRGISVEGGGEIVERSTVNLYINFDYDSARLAQDGKIVLDRLGAALTDKELSGFEFLIGGHTDAAGSDQYNMTLSQRRAESVRDYLTQNFTIAPGHLVVTGFGESRLLDPSTPLDGVNRRVQITNISVPSQ